MNTRLLELASDAERAGNMGDHVDVVMMMEKFAELIIEEVVWVITNTNDRHRKEYFAELVRKYFEVE